MRKGGEGEEEDGVRAEEREGGTSREAEVQAEPEEQATFFRPRRRDSPST